MTDAPLRGFLDESSARRHPDNQEYLVCAALIPQNECDTIRDAIQPLLLPGQIKLHWTDESERRRRDIVQRIVELGPINIVISHVDHRRNKVERYRRKCLETLYHELTSMDVTDLTLESRSTSQDKSDRAHIVALQNQGLEKRLRITHLRGGEEPLLWIADAVLGAINARHLGEPKYLDILEETILMHRQTADSLSSTQSERP